MQERIPIILCSGANGRCVVFGYVDEEPQPGQPVRLHNARMILRWQNTDGLFGVAANGPASGSRITPAVPVTVETVWQEWIACTPGAAEALAGWPR